LSQGSIDIGGSSILFNLGTILSASFATDTFNGYIFSDLDWIGQPGAIVGVGLTTDIDGLDASRVSFGSDFVAVNFSALQLDGNDTFFELALEASHVPEPATLGLLGLGIVVIGAIRKKRAS
jgi:hypothetical protein